jgi:hypothetical protein
MELRDIEKQEDWQQVAREIRESSLPEMDRLAYAFGWITDRIIEQGMRNIELARALRDDDSVIKYQIQTEVIRHARNIFQSCHLLVTGRKAWDE